jgi:hypothetical protein
MMACLLAEIRTNQEHLKEEMKSTPERRNVEQVRCSSQKDDGQDRVPASENGGLSTKDGGHRFGGKSKRKNPHWCMRSLKKRQQ